MHTYSRVYQVNKLARSVHSGQKHQNWWEKYLGSTYWF